MNTLPIAIAYWICRRRSGNKNLWCAALIAALTLLTKSPELRASESERIKPAPITGPTSEFHLGRLYYEPLAAHQWHPAGRPWWRIDWPEAEQHWISGISRYTVINSADDSAHVTLKDDAIFDYPFLFAQQVGRWSLDDEEVIQLGEYLKRGGFLFADDIHGPEQWNTVERVLNQALPDYPIVEIDPDSALLSIVFPIEELTQIPGRRHIVGLRADGTAVVRMPFRPQRWLGIYDTEDRLIAAFNLNMDIGDAWEHADDPAYPVQMTALAYKIGINYIIYSMSH